MSGGVTGTHVAGEPGKISDDNARDSAILALQAFQAGASAAYVPGVAGGRAHAWSRRRTLKVRRTFLKKQAGPANTAEVNLINIASGAGIIDRIWCAIAPQVGGTYPQYDHRIRIYTDGSGTPDLELDAAIFFGYANAPQFPAGRIHSEHFVAKAYSTGAETHGIMRLPIFFSNGVRVAVYNSSNAGDSWIFSQVDHTLAADEPALTVPPYRLKGDRFTRTAEIAPGTSLTLHTITAGNDGLLAAHSMTAISNGSLAGPSYMERNIAVSVDGEGTASFKSSGTEDWFDTSFYGDGEQLYSAPSAMGFGFQTVSPYCMSAVADLLAEGGIPFDSSAIVDWTTNGDAALVHGATYITSGLFYYRHT